MNTINPFKLFGIDYKNIDEKSLKKKYYELALLCHPDKGGNKDDMIMIVNSYNYISEQVENCKDIDDYETMEKDFDDFCKNQEAETPDFNEIFKESDDYKRNIKFNEEFEKMKNLRILQQNSYNEPSPELEVQSNLTWESDYDDITINSYANTSFYDNGYNDYMEESKYNEKNINYNSNIDINNENIKSTQKQFPNIVKNQLTIYKPIEFTPTGYGNYFRFDIKKPDDYSSEVDNINVSDYKNAFTILGQENINDYKIKEKTLEELIQERDNLLFNY